MALEASGVFNEKVIQFFLRFGIAGIFAGVLLGVFIGDVRADQKKTRDEHIELQQQHARIENILEQSLRSQGGMLYLQRRQCINTAKTQLDREACARDKD